MNAIPLKKSYTYERRDTEKIKPLAKENPCFFSLTHLIRIRNRKEVIMKIQLGA